MLEDVGALTTSDPFANCSAAAVDSDPIAPKAIAILSKLQINYRKEIMNNGLNIYLLISYRSTRFHIFMNHYLVDGQIAQVRFE